MKKYYVVHVRQALFGTGFHTFESEFDTPRQALLWKRMLEGEEKKDNRWPIVHVFYRCR